VRLKRSRPATSRPRSSRRRRHRVRGDGTTEQHILDAAHAVFLRRGTFGARMQDIAREAGVNQALLHYYFRTKERLSEAVFHRAAGQLLPRVIEVMASELSIEDKIARVVELEVDHLLRAPYLPGFIMSELHHRPERVRQLLTAVTGMMPEEVHPRVFTGLRRQLDEGARDGRFRPMAPDQFIVNLFSLCIFPFAARPMLMALLGFDQQAFERFIAVRRAELADFVLRAMRP
jgi:AcrR family transcriptional regulator